MKKIILLSILAASNILLLSACVLNKEEQPVATAPAPVRTTTTHTESHEIHAY